MSLLVISMPAASGLDPAGAARWRWPWLLSDDGRSVLRSGVGSAAELPRADQRVLVLGASQVAWHRCDIPKAPAARLRAALAGVLEEHLLDDTDAVHLALAEASQPGATGWVAACDQALLAAAIGALESPEAGGQALDRVVAAAEPPSDGRRVLHFHAAAESLDGPGADDSHLTLLLAGPDGVAEVAAEGGLARALLADTDAAASRDISEISATPAAAAAAERWLGAPVRVQGTAERLLQAATEGSNLRQFALQARHRGTRALREALRRLLSPAWKPVRWGLAGLLAVQLVGLNAHAWQQQRAIQARQGQQLALLREAHPGVPVVLAAPMQMQRETERLRTAAGRPGPGDFESLLAVAAAAWPDGVGPAAAVGFEAGRLTLSVPGWAEAQWQQFDQRLRASGHVAEFAGGQLRLMPPRPGAGGPR
jgi:general secretion pathway protein L